MRTLLFSTFIFLCVVSLYAQAPSIQWQKCLGGSAEDYCYAIKQTSDGGYVAGGRTSSGNGDVSGIHSSMGPAADVWLTKVNSAGTLQWQKCLGGSGDEEGYALEQTSDGGFILAGLAGCNDGDLSGYLGAGDFWVVKLDALGSIQWQKCLGGSGYDIAYAAHQNNDGTYIVAGSSASTGGDVSANHGSDDFWVVKLDALGNLVWQKSLGGSGSDVAACLQQTSDGAYVIAGHTFSNDGDVSGYLGQGNFWVVKLDTAGTLLWQKCLGGSAYTEQAFCIEATSDGGVAVAGRSGSTDGDLTFNYGMADYWIVKLTSGGNLQWQRSFGGTQDDIAWGIEQCSDGGYAVVGYTESSDGNVSANSGFSDLWLIKLDGNGNLQWEKSYGGSTGYDAGTSIVQTADGGFIVGGYTSSADGDVSGLHGSSDFWLLKLNPETSGINGLRTEQEMKIFPNPSSGRFKITDGATRDVKIKVRNIFGQTISNIQLNEQDEIDLSAQPKGIYFVEMQCGNECRKTKLVLQ
ncbi:MAG: T9SS type A sorting domain-containing protein [Bacteroidia bacterium]